MNHILDHCLTFEPHIAHIYNFITRSEEDNTDDGSAIGINQPWSRTGQPPVGGSSIIQGNGVPTRQGVHNSKNLLGRNNSGSGQAQGSGPTSATSRLAHVTAAATVDAGDSSGVDSPTYDGDVETNTAVPSSKHSPVSTISSKLSHADNTLREEGEGEEGPPVGQGLGEIPQDEEHVVASLLSLAGPTTTTPSSPVSSTYPDPPSSTVSTAEYDGTDDEGSSFSGRGPAASSSARRSTATNAQRPVIHLAGPSTSSASEMMIPQSAILPAHKATPKAQERPLLPDTAPQDVEYAASEGDDTMVNTSVLSPEDIRAFVQKGYRG